MFTGIVEATAKIVSSKPNALTIERPASFDDLRIGSSVLVSGVCLTIVDLTESTMTFDVVPETLKRSTLGSRVPGDQVNLERALAATGRFDGHIVQGHVEEVGTVISGQRLAVSQKKIAEEDLEATLLIIAAPRDLLPFIIPKGSITIDGVSLTIANIKDNEITLALISETLRTTTLGALQKGDRVNIETDMLVRAVLTNRPS